MKAPALLLALALGTLPAASARGDAAPVLCDGTTALTLLGMDTASGRTLFSAPSSDGKSFWLIELDGDGKSARAWPDDPKGRFSGSVGPGPVLAAQPCGPSCLQPVRWQNGAWEPLGDTLSAPTASTVAPTYDHSGTPWFLLFGATETTGQQKVWAFRLEGREWQSRGGATAAAVGQPAALPAPQRKDGVLTGTILFSVSGSPQTWVSGLPGVPVERRGQLIALNGTAAAYVSGDGIAYLSEDSGKTWRRSTWTPWGSTGTTGIWRQGNDYWVDFPFGDHRGSLRLVWFDRRNPKEEVVILSRLTSSGWQRVIDVPGEVKTKNERFPVTQVLVPQGDLWILLSGCAATAQGSGLVLRVYDGTSLSEARLVPLTTN